jgi:hypothetical protein
MFEQLTLEELEIIGRTAAFNTNKERDALKPNRETRKEIRGRKAAARNIKPSNRQGHRGQQKQQWLFEADAE